LGLLWVGQGRPAVGCDGQLRGADARCLLAPVAARAAEVTQIAGESWQTTTALTRTTTPG
jgi:hypothetical protein